MCVVVAPGEPTAAELAQHPNLLLRTACQPCAACPTLSTRSPHCRRRRPQRGSGLQLLAAYDAAAAKASRPASSNPPPCSVDGFVTHASHPEPQAASSSRDPLCIALCGLGRRSKAQNGPTAHTLCLGYTSPMQVPPLLHTRSGILSTASAAHRLGRVPQTRHQIRSRGRPVASDAQIRIMRFGLPGAAFHSPQGSRHFGSLSGEMASAASSARVATASRACAPSQHSAVGSMPTRVATRVATLKAPLAAKFGTRHGASRRDRLPAVRGDISTSHGRLHVPHMHRRDSCAAGVGHRPEL